MKKHLADGQKCLLQHLLTFSLIYLVSLESANQGHEGKYVPRTPCRKDHKQGWQQQQAAGSRFLCGAAIFTEFIGLSEVHSKQWYNKCRVPRKDLPFLLWIPCVWDRCMTDRGTSPFLRDALRIYSSEAVKRTVTIAANKDSKYTPFCCQRRHFDRKLTHDGALYHSNLCMSLDAVSCSRSSSKSDDIPLAAQPSQKSLSLNHCSTLELQEAEGVNDPEQVIKLALFYWMWKEKWALWLA